MLWWSGERFLASDRGLPSAALKRIRPLSDVMSAGTPKRATHPLMRASAPSSVEVARRGMASGHLVDLSTTVNRWLNPSLETGSGPTRSTCMCENRLRGTYICWTGACTCLVILALLQATQSLHHTATSAAIAGHTNLAAMRRLEPSPLGERCCAAG
jgi:hypothetical protein